MGGVSRVGIEKIGVWPGTLSLGMRELCEARGHDIAAVRDDMLIDERSVSPLWEDPVTMAVNAARTMLSAEDRASIELLIVASESGVDYEKSMSTWVHRYLDLTPHCRNFELKHACYGGTAGLQMAARNVHGAGDVSHLVLGLLAHVEDHGRLGRVAIGRAVVQDLLDLGGIELLDPGASLLDELLA